MNDHPELFEALLAVQQQLPHVSKAAEADTGKYTYRYATLSDVHDAILPLLHDNGLVWTVGGDVDPPSVVGTMIHVPSGGTYTTAWPLPKTDDPQRLGSALSYARRYLLCALVGLVPDEDDDGQRARQQAPTETEVAHLVGLIGEATDAGVDGDFDAMLSYAEQSQENLTAATRKLKRLIAQAKVVDDERTDDVPY